jgi:ADP-ribosylarginine hydrolase
MKISKAKYDYIMLLHAVGDTIGFYNGIFEFNFFQSDQNYKITMEIIFEFIKLGGYSGINLEKWNVSDDTLFHIAMARSLLKVDFKSKLSDKNLLLIKKEFKSTLKMISETQDDKIFVLMNSNTIDLEKDPYKLFKYKFRGIGTTTHENISNKNLYIDETKINIKKSGGNGCAMRTLCIGLVFHDDLDKLIEYSIKSSMITHINPIGFLGGLTSAYFISLALNNIDLYKWPSMLIELIESPKVKSYIDEKNFDMIVQYRHFISLWKKYIEMRFNQKLKPLFLNSHKNLISRTKFHYDFMMNYDIQGLQEVEGKPNEMMNTIGGSGVTCMIMVYDSLLDAGNSFEKLIYYGMLHAGDSDTVGAIAAGIFGAIYGDDSDVIPHHMLLNIEFKKELLELSEKLYKEYSK